MKKHTLSTLIHMLEVAVVIALAVGVSYAFPEHRDIALGIVGVTLAGVAKQARSNPSIPVPDYVNQQ